MIEAEKFAEYKRKAETIYSRQKEILCPYFQSPIRLNSDGFHHLQFSARRERSKDEQMLKFRLLPLALDVIRKSGTLQEFRETMSPIGKKSKSGFTALKQTTYWGFAAITGQNKIKIRVILRRIGDGNIIFWSVMPDSKLKNGQRLHDKNIEDE